MSLSQARSVAAAAIAIARSGAIPVSDFASVIATLGNAQSGRTIVGEYVAPRKLRAAKRAARTISAPVEVLTETSFADVTESDAGFDVVFASDIPVEAPPVETPVEAPPVEAPVEIPVEAPPSPSEAPPTVDVQSTFRPEGILCLIDNKVVKDLGRHARKHFGVNAVQYRERFGLPEAYPMTLEGVAKFINA